MSETQQQVIARAAAAAGIPASLLWGEYGAETDYGQDVQTSSAGAVGPFQFEPSTAASLGINPYDFTQAAYGAARYLAQAKSGGINAMILHYNPGGGHAYINDVLSHETGGPTSTPTTSSTPAQPEKSTPTSTAGEGLSGWLAGLLDKGALYLALISGAAAAIFFGLKYMLSPPGGAS